MKNNERRVSTSSHWTGDVKPKDPRYEPWVLHWLAMSFGARVCSSDQTVETWYRVPTDTPARSVASRAQLVSHVSQSFLWHEIMNSVQTYENNEHLSLHQHDKNDLTGKIAACLSSLSFWFGSSPILLTLRGRGLWPILQPAIGEQSRCFGSTWGEKLVLSNLIWLMQINMDIP